MTGCCKGGGSERKMSQVKKKVENEFKVKIRKESGGKKIKKFNKINRYISAVFSIYT